MKKNINDFALFGGVPEFIDPLHVAQVNLPPWGKIEEVFRGIFDRQYYANHGPLVRELDNVFADYIGIKHAVCVTNGTVALMLLSKALDLSGEVILPAFTFPATAQALMWAGLTPVFCDVDPVSHMITPETIEPFITSRTTAILGVHLWGRPCHLEELENFTASKELKLFFDACHGIGCTYKSRQIGTFGSGEAFSFHATKILNGGEGGCITTNDDDLADSLRTMRSFHPTETFAHVPFRMNGKMSEAQAGLALTSLEQLDENILKNRNRYHRFEKHLSNIPGITLIDMEADNSTNNYQYIVVEIDRNNFGLSRDQVLSLFISENINCRRHFYPGLHSMFPYLCDANSTCQFKNTEWLSNRLIQLPNSQLMKNEHIDRICELFNSMFELSDSLQENMVVK